MEIGSSDGHQKVTFTHDGDYYSADVQERLSICALYKSTVDDAYVAG